MYRNFKNEVGVGARLYRTTDEIRTDIKEVKDSIRSITERLNPRTLLIDIINDKRCGNPRELLSSLEDALARAQDAYVEIKKLRCELFDLEEELRETLCEMGY